MDNRLTLGMTTIGDLLLKNRITMTDEGRSVEAVRLTIPEYQRPYKWTAKNANQLLDDIEEAMRQNKEVYRVGTLILHLDQTGRLNIVDGQQRTITFALLLDCLKVRPIAFLQQQLANNRYNRHNVINNYKAFERRIGKLYPEDKDKNKLTDFIKNRCELIVVITGDISDAFQFFDSQNARGKALYPHDLLKAYHLREMAGIDARETERIVGMWEELNQKELAALFNEYLYRLKEWMRSRRAGELSESNIDLFKGISARHNHPFAQYYKGAFAYADELNRSLVPFVTGIQPVNPFQLNAPIIAGKPFFEYAKHYFDILADIRNNDKYEGYFVNDNPIVKTLDLRKYKNGVGNRIARLLFDTAILLYVDRFCPAIPSGTDLKDLDQFIVYAFIWAYSLRAQYRNVGWLVAQNYVLGNAGRDGVVNSFNIYREIAEADAPGLLLSRMADMIEPLEEGRIRAGLNDIGKEDEAGVQQHYLDHFINNHYLGERTDG